jgi:hypothetical protein
METHPVAEDADLTRRGKSPPQDFGGTVADRNDMANLGLKQETRRIFTGITMTMFGYAIITSSHLVVSSVGTAGLFWGFALVAAIFSIVYTSIAEMTSIVGSNAVCWVAS